MERGFDGVQSTMGGQSRGGLGAAAGPLEATGNTYLPEREENTGYPPLALLACAAAKDCTVRVTDM